VVGQVLKNREGLLESGYGLAECGAFKRPSACLSTVHYGFVPHFSSHSMMGEPLNLINYLLATECFKRLDYPLMQYPAPSLEQTAVGHLMGQGMLERVDAFGKEAGLVENLGGL
jgi:hypothetical protein